MRANARSALVSPLISGSEEGKRAEMLCLLLQQTILLEIGKVGGGIHDESENGRLTQLEPSRLRVRR